MENLDVLGNLIEGIATGLSRVIFDKILNPKKKSGKSGSIGKSVRKKK